MLTIKPAREALTRKYIDCIRIDIYKDTRYILSIHNASTLTSDRILNLLSNGYKLEPVLPH
jgi:hypothetical protein